MVEIWYVILTFMLTMYLVLDGRNFGAGALQHVVARTAEERRQVVAAIGPLWSWDEVWLISTGGVLFAAFPRFLAVSFAGYYLALFLVLWSLILRGIAIEVGGHIDNPLWQTFWNFVFSVSSLLMAVLLGVALGNVVRGVPVGPGGEFHLAFFTDFGVRGEVGLLDWYTVSLGVFTLVMFCAHGATYLVLKTEGAVWERSEKAARQLWWLVGVGVVGITVETWYVRPELFGDVLHRPLAWVTVVGAAAGAGAIITGFRGRKEARAFAGSCLLLASFFAGGAAAIFPDMLHSTLAAEHSLTAYNSSTSAEGLKVGIMWWPAAMVLSVGYYAFVLRQYRGKVRLLGDGPGY